MGNNNTLPLMSHLPATLVTCCPRAAAGPFLPAHYKVKYAWSPKDHTRAWALLIMQVCHAPPTPHVLAVHHAAADTWQRMAVWPWVWLRCD